MPLRETVLYDCMAFTVSPEEGKGLDIGSYAKGMVHYKTYEFSLLLLRLNPG